jgi:MEMO1 family protein
MSGDVVRRAAVAGLFYPDDLCAIEADLAGLIAPADELLDARALVVPHAGWMYSGRVAGAVYGRVRLPRIAVILGPNHTGVGPWGSIMTSGWWDLPGGAVPIAREVAEAIRSASRVLEDDEEAHRREHAIEVQLPFLRRLRRDVAFVPITLMRADLAFCRDIGLAVALAVAAAAEPIVIVCSTDLNHYESQTVSNWKDRLAIDAIRGLDPGRLLSTVRQHRISMCGVGPAVTTLFAAQALEHGDVELVRYETSGDVSGDYRRVVGYAGLIIPRRTGRSEGSPHCSTGP